MKAATVNEIKSALTDASQKELVTLCLRLAKFKKENKELLTYLLFEANDEQGFVKGIEAEIDEHFAAINMSQLYFAKKSLRKIVRIINKYCRYSDNKETEIQLRLHFCKQLIASGISYKRNTVINNLFESQLKKIRAVIDTLHEDLQYEYQREVGKLGL